MSRQLQRLVRHHAHRAALHAREAHHDVLREVGRRLEELLLVHHQLHQLLHVVRHVRVLRHDVRQRRLRAAPRVRAHAARHAVPVVQRQVVVERPHRAQHLHVVVERALRHARLLRVDRRAAQLLLRHLLLRHRLHHVRTRDEHVRRVAHHEDEVRDRGRVHRAARARTHDQRDLRNHARRQRVPLEDLRVPRQRVAALLDTSAARVVQTDHRSAHVHRLVHHLADLLRVRSRQRTAQHREVLREQEHQTTVDRAVARHHTVARVVLLLHAEMHAAVRLQLVVLAERTLIHQQLDALASSQLPALVLRINALLASANQGAVASFRESFSERLR